MKVKVKLFGALSQRFQHLQGLDVEIPEGATVKELFTHLGISEVQGVVVIAEGRILKADDKIQGGVTVNVFQAIYGG